MSISNRVDAEDGGPRAHLGRGHPGVGGHDVPLEAPANFDGHVAAFNAAQYLGIVTLVQDIGPKGKGDDFWRLCNRKFTKKCNQACWYFMTSIFRGCEKTRTLILLAPVQNVFSV